MIAAAHAVRAATIADADAWGALRAALWPDADDAFDRDAMAAMLADADAVALLAECDGRVVGFAEATLRRDYVNGTATSPVGFLEGWYVDAAWRGRGIGRALVAAVADWSVAKGARELASDSLLGNTPAHAAHAACGFEETERVVYFRRWIA